MTTNPKLFCKLCKCGDQIFLGQVNVGRIYSHHHKYPFGKNANFIDYYLCSSCSFLYSPSWDDKDDKFWNENIYNEDYAKSVDPDFVEKRSNDIAPVIHKIIDIFNKKEEFKIVDYRSGEAILGNLLKNEGIHVDSFDPYSKSSLSKKTINNTNIHQYDLLIAIEVFEHAVSPIELMEMLMQLANKDAKILFTTKIRSEKNKDLEWPYIAPRNGHISIFSKKSLQVLSSKFNLTYTNLFFFHLFSKHKLSLGIKMQLLFVIFKFKLNFHLKRVF